MFRKNTFRTNFSYESSESYRVFNCLHESNSIFGPRDLIQNEFRWAYKGVKRDRTLWWKTNVRSPARYATSTQLRLDLSCRSILCSHHIGGSSLHQRLWRGRSLFNLDVCFVETISFTVIRLLWHVWLFILRPHTQSPFLCCGRCCGRWVSKGLLMRPNNSRCVRRLGARTTLWSSLFAKLIRRQ